jgi:hypothetical protein
MQNRAICGDAERHRWGSSTAAMKRMRICYVHYCVLRRGEMSPSGIPIELTIPTVHVSIIPFNQRLHMHQPSLNNVPQRTRAQLTNRRPIRYWPA